MSKQMPLRYRMLLTGLITPITDFTCQFFIEKRRDPSTYNFSRTARQAIVASFFVAPSIYIYSTKIVAKFLPGVIGLQKINKHHLYFLLTEMLIFQPWLMFGIFFNLEYLLTLNIDNGIRNSISRAPLMINYTAIYFPIIMLMKFALIKPFYRPVFFAIFNLPVALGVSFLNNLNFGLSPNKLKVIEKYEEFNKKYNFFYKNLMELRQERINILKEGEFLIVKTEKKTWGKKKQIL